MAMRHFAVCMSIGRLRADAFAAVWLSFMAEQPKLIGIRIPEVAATPCC